MRGEASRGADMGLNPLDNDNPHSDNSQTRPKFDWPKLRKAIEFYEKEGLCYLPAGWGRLAHSLLTGGGSYGSI